MNTSSLSFDKYLDQHTIFCKEFTNWVIMFWAIREEWTVIVSQAKYCMFHPQCILKCFMNKCKVKWVIWRSTLKRPVIQPSPNLTLWIMNNHWGQGYPETSGNILGTLQALGQFSSIVINRHIYGTFGMCLHNETEMFPTDTFRAHLKCVSTMKLKCLQQ